MGSFSPESYVYLDWAATALLCDEAACAMKPYLAPGRANVALGTNANSLHSPGRAVFAALEDARRSIAHDLNASRASEIIFTSGATEADNAAILGLAHAAVEKRQRSGHPCASPHIITTAVEHEAVLEPVHFLERQGFRSSILSVDARGFVSARELEQSLDGETVLVSVQMANSEVGSIQPIAGLARTAHAAGALFHTDATQALGKIPIDVRAFDVDAASFSAHKLGGPKGIGALYLRARTPFITQQLGGGQEDGRRSGTQNVCGAAGFAAACRAVCSQQKQEAERERTLRDRLYAALVEHPTVNATVEVNPGCQDFLPNIVHVLVDGLESQTLILRLDSLGFGVSGGSACASHDLDTSHVLRAMGVPHNRAQGALRVSFGRYTSSCDIDAFVEAFGKALMWQ